jgi:hypothetical protein
MTIPLSCTKCRAALPPATLNRADWSACPGCGALIRADVFPALFKKTATVAAEDILADSRAGCYFHPQKKAVVPCSSCGRFLCSLCDVELGDKHVCPSCLEAGKNKRKIRNLETERVLYDSIALSLAILPILVWFITIVTAPISIYYSVRYWKSPTSILPRTKVRFVFAVLLSTAQLGGWFLFFSTILKSRI